MNSNKLNTTASRGGRSGVTLIELTVVIFVILSMIGATMYFGGNLSAWKKGKAASESLRAVYAAQRAFLADNPRRTLASLTSAELVGYLPNQSGRMPSIESLDGASLKRYGGIKKPVLIPIKKSRGRDWGTNEAASIIKGATV